MSVSTTSTVHSDVAALMAELERAKAENAALKAAQSRGLSIKISEKGAVSVYGLGRFPTTLYPEQWQKILSADNAKMILAFVENGLANGTLTTKLQRQAAGKAE